MTKLALATSLLVALLLSSSFDSTMAGSSFCNSKRVVWCSKAGRKDWCLEYCGICCGKCHCVLSGTYGNKDECPCYRDMKNSKGSPSALSVVLFSFVSMACMNITLRL